MSKNVFQINKVSLNQYRNITENKYVDSKDPSLKMSKLEILAARVFVRIENGIITNIDTDEIIPEELMYYQKTPEDGEYILTHSSCGFKREVCDVGNHLNGCTMYSKTKCAVYFTEDLLKGLRRIQSESMTLGYEISDENMSN